MRDSFAVGTRVSWLAPLRALPAQVDQAGFRERLRLTAVSAVWPPWAFRLWCSPWS
jgi:hypothetical protein